MDNEGQLVIYPIPSLIATLLHQEREKGTPLTQEEVLQIRDNAPSVALTHEQVTKVEKRRGYIDIDPENCWSQWQEHRQRLLDHPPKEQ